MDDWPAEVEECLDLNKLSQAPHDYVSFASCGLIDSPVPQDRHVNFNFWPKTFFTGHFFNHILVPFYSIAVSGSIKEGKLVLKIYQYILWHFYSTYPF